MKEGRDQARKVYQRGVERNPYCFQLWKLYYFWAKDSYEEKSVSGLILEQGLEKIGRDFESFFMWEDYLKREAEMKRKIEWFRKALEIPLRNSEQLYLRFVEYITSKSNGEMAEYQKDISTTTSIQEIKDSLLREMERLYSLRSQQVKDKIKWEDKVIII